MSPLYTYKGVLLAINNALAIDENCCCDETIPSSGIDCTECVDGLYISLGGNPTCTNYPDAASIYSDIIPCGPGDIESNGYISASMFCVQIEDYWSVSVTVNCYNLENNDDCFYGYEAILPKEADGKPPAGPINLTQTYGFDNGACPPLPPSVSIIK